MNKNQKNKTTVWQYSGANQLVPGRKISKEITYGHII